MYHNPSMPKKASIEIAEDDPAQQDIALQARKTLKSIYNHTVEKENITTIQPSLKTVEHETKKKTSNASTQTDKPVDRYVPTADDLTDLSGSINYWHKRAEQSSSWLHEAWEENDKLKSEVEHYKQLHAQSEIMLQESRDMIDVLKEVLADVETGEGDAQES